MVGEAAAEVAFPDERKRKKCIISRMSLSRFTVGRIMAEL
jgi:hypothetical protein